MAEIILKNNTWYIKVTYSASNGTVTISKLAGYDSDSIRSYDQSAKSVSISVAGTSKSVSLSHYVDFGTSSSSYTNWGSSSTSWTGLRGNSASITITMPSSSTTIGNKVFSSTSDGKSASLVMAWSTYTITYDANGGSLGSIPSTQTKTHGTDITVPAETPTLAGHNFLGWAVPGRGYDEVYYDPNEAIQYNGNQTLVAVWEPYSHTVQYNANGGTGAPESQTKTYGGVIQITTDTPIKEGHDFVRWNTEPDDSGTPYASGQTYGYDQDGGTVILYAIWKIHTYPVSYDGNKGNNTPDNQTKIYGVDLTLTNEKPTRTAYTFLGWATSADGEIEYLPGDVYTDNAPLTLYAIWRPSGLIYIDNGSQFDAHFVYIDNGTDWDLYIPYIDDGTNWNIMS